MKEPRVIHDERTMAVANNSYRIAYIALTFGLLLSVMYRAFVLNEASWDLLGLVFVGGLITTLYQAAYKVISRRWFVVTLAAMGAAAALAAFAAFMYSR